MSTYDSGPSNLAFPPAFLSLVTYVPYYIYIYIAKQARQRYSSKFQLFWSSSSFHHLSNYKNSPLFFSGTKCCFHVPSPPPPSSPSSKIARGRSPSYVTAPPAKNGLFGLEGRGQGCPNIYCMGTTICSSCFCHKICAIIVSHFLTLAYTSYVVGIYTNMPFSILLAFVLQLVPLQLCIFESVATRCCRSKI